MTRKVRSSPLYEPTAAPSDSEPGWVYIRVQDILSGDFVMVYLGADEAARLAPQLVDAAKAAAERDPGDT